MQTMLQRFLLPAADFMPFWHIARGAPV